MACMSSSTSTDCQANNQTIGKRVSRLDWWYNETALEWSMKTINAVLDFIQQPGQSFTLELVNAPMDNPGDIGQPTALSNKATPRLLKGCNAVVDRVAAAKSQITVMLDDGFKGVANFNQDKYIVFDLHYYNHFNGRPAGSTNVTEMICANAKRSRVDKFAVFTGESSIEMLAAFGKYMAGSAYWTGRVMNTERVAGQDPKRDYWSFEDLELGLVDLEFALGFCQQIKAVGQTFI